MRITFVYPAILWLFLLLPITVGLALAGVRRPTKARFWFGLTLRSLLLSAVILALAGIQLQLRADFLTTVFILDFSDSIPEEQKTQGETIIQQALEDMPQGDRAAVVVFGKDALVERLATEDNILGKITSIPVTSRTDLAGALQLALALFPEEGAKRIVLLSDGRENVGIAIDQAELAAAQLVELTYVPLSGPEGNVEVLLDSITLPASLRKGQGFDLNVEAITSAGVDGRLQVFRDGQLIHSQNVTMQTGGNHYLIPVEADEPGFHRFSAQIVPEVDTRLQNNEVYAFTVVEGPPKVLVVEGEEGEAANFVEALESVEMEVETTAAAEMPVTLTGLAGYEAIVLVNVPARQLPTGVMEALPVYVQELGKGLLMVGGDNGYGAGGYLRTPVEDVLPVYMDVRARELEANLALVLAVDKSGSMGRCHCDDPDLRQDYTRQEVGQPKVDIAKDAVMSAASALGPQDQLGVVAFDQSAKWALELSPLVEFSALENSIGGIQAAGQTNIYAGVQAAYAQLQDADARRKHVILLTDGWTHSGDLTEIVSQMEAEGITFSVVAAGGGSAEYLETLSELGGGRYYPAVDILSVPDFFLKETVQSVGEYIVEEPFYPLPGVVSPVMRGLDTLNLPPLYGYNGTSAKTTARIDLVTPSGDPLMATWQYGLGRAAVWTSDLKGQWAVDWVTWDGFGRFSVQLMSWLLPAPQVEGMIAETRLEDDRAVVTVEAYDEIGRVRNFLSGQVVFVGPDMEAVEAELEQIGPGKYQASVEVSDAGTYLVRLGVNEGVQSLGQQILGLVVPYSPEYKAGSTNLSLLNELAELTGGGLLASPESAFLHDLAASTFSREIWRPLLMAVALLFPLDVAVRRVIIGKRDWVKARLWVISQFDKVRKGTGEESPQILGNLFEARQRARQRRSANRDLEAFEVKAQPPKRLEPDEGKLREEAPGQPEDESEESGANDTFSRLRKAKRRARKD